jgi:hypothetical protein
MDSLLILFFCLTIIRSSVTTIMEVFGLRVQRNKEIRQMPNIGRIKVEFLTLVGRKNKNGTLHDTSRRDFSEIHDDEKAPSLGNERA